MRGWIRAFTILSEEQIPLINNIWEGKKCMFPYLTLNDGEMYENKTKQLINKLGQMF